MNYDDYDFDEAMQSKIYDDEKNERKLRQDISYWFEALDSELKGNAPFSADLVERCLEEMAFYLKCHLDPYPLNIARGLKIVDINFLQKAVN